LYIFGIDPPLEKKKQDKTKEMDIFHINILQNIIPFLDKNSLYKLMISNKDLLFKVGRCDRWIDFVSPTKINKEYYKMNYYTYLCQNLVSNPMIKNNIQMRDYYSQAYYCFRYIGLNFDGYLCLYNVMKCSGKDLQRFRVVIEEYQQRPIYKYDNLIEPYNNLRYNLHLLKKHLRIKDRNILKHIMLPPLYYDLAHLIINVDNDFYDEELISDVGYCNRDK